jgi:hypothetical protein
MEQSKCGKELVIWMFEFLEESGARRISGLANIKGRGLVAGREGSFNRGNTHLVLTFVLLSTHLIII